MRLEIYGMLKQPDHLFPSHQCSYIIHADKIRFLINSTVEINIDMRWSMNKKEILSIDSVLLL